MSTDTTTKQTGELTGSRFTPGPWLARTYPNSKGQIVNVKIWAPDEFHGNLVCAMSPETPAAVQGTEAFANARLIAAAPELLGALQAVLASASPHPEEQPTMYGAFKQARAAIAKALPAPSPSVR